MNSSDAVTKGRMRKGPNPKARDRGFLIRADGARIREVVRCGAKQLDVAKMWGVSPQYINDIVKERCLAYS